MPLLARVHRTRLAFAVSATVAALPILVVDNLPATADPGPRVEVAGIAGPEIAGEAPAGALQEPWIAETATHADPPATLSTTASTTTPTVGEPTDPAPSAASEADAARSVPASEPPVQVPTAAAPTTANAAPTATAAPRPVAPGDPADPATWDRLARCESGGNWSLNTGNGYYGGLQFTLVSWHDAGGQGYPHQASREEQIRRGRALQARYGWGQWPYCAQRLGYR